MDFVIKIGRGFTVRVSRVMYPVEKKVLKEQKNQSVEKYLADGTHLCMKVSVTCSMGPTYFRTV